MILKRLKRQNGLSENEYKLIMTGSVELYIYVSSHNYFINRFLKNIWKNNCKYDKI